MDAYKTIAPVYDAVTGAFLRKPRKMIVEACAALKAWRVLDVGCGTGVLAAMLREGRTELVAGLDRSDAMLAAGSRKNAPLPAPAVSRSGASPAQSLFVRGDAAFPPFKPGSFDALVYALILHETTADADALVKAGFALAPLALILEWRMPERNLDVLAASWVHGIERLAGREHYRQFRAFMQTGGVRGLALRVGARIVSERALAGNSLVLATLRQE